MPPMPVEFVDKFRELGDYLWSACTEIPMDMAEEMLNLVGDDVDDLLERFPECVSAPPCSELLASWKEAYSWAATYITSSDRFEECIWVVGSPHTVAAPPIELSQAFARLRAQLQLCLPHA
jgi:hypothetical protein